MWSRNMKAVSEMRHAWKTKGPCLMYENEKHRGVAADRIPPSIMGADVVEDRVFLVKALSLRHNGAGG